MVDLRPARQLNVQLLPWYRNAPFDSIALCLFFWWRASVPQHECHLATGEALASARDASGGWLT